jgi:glucuronate isomerase
MEDQEQPKTREEILEVSLEARTQEVMGYQINIDNNTNALSEIGKKSPADHAAFSEFSQQLRNLLASEKLEQKKAEIMLAVIQQQVS